MLRFFFLGLPLVVVVHAVESSNPKKSTAKSHVSVDADGEVHPVAARAQHAAPDEPKVENKEPSKMAAGFHVRSSVESPKTSKSKGIKEHKTEAVAVTDKTVRVDAAAAAPTEDPAPKQNAPPAEAQTEAPSDAAPGSTSEPSSSPDKSTDAPAPAKQPAEPVSAEPESNAEPPLIAKVFVAITLVAAFLLVGFMMRERIMESLPSGLQDMVSSTRQQLGFETALRESRPSGPRKKMGIERSESSQEYSSMRQASYADQSEYLSPVQSETSSSAEGDVPVGRA